MNSLQALKRQNTRKTPKKRWQNRGQLPATLNSWSLLVQYTLVPSSQCQQKKQKRPKLFGLCFAFYLDWQWKGNRECQVIPFCR
jgi:hypothetical protein